MKRTKLNIMKDQEEMEKLHNTTFEMLTVMRGKYEKPFPDQSAIIIPYLEKISNEMNAIRLKMISGETGTKTNAIK